MTIDGVIGCQISDTHAYVYDSRSMVYVGVTSAGIGSRHVASFGCMIKQAVFFDRVACVAVKNRNSVNIIDVENGKLLFANDGEVLPDADSVSFGSRRICYGPLFRDSDRAQYVIWRHSVCGITIIDTAKCSVFRKFVTFWPKDLAPMFVALNNSCNVAIGFSLGGYSKSCYSILTGAFNGNTELEQIELTTTDSIIGMCLSSCGKFIITASTVIYQDNTNVSKSAIHMKAHTYANCRISLHCEKHFTLNIDVNNIIAVKHHECQLTTMTVSTCYMKHTISFTGKKFTILSSISHGMIAADFHRQSTIAVIQDKAYIN